MDKPWKRTERAVAARLSGQRVPITGRQRGDVPDIKHRWLSIEVKSRKTLPAWLHTAMSQAVAAIRGVQLPVVILHQTGARHDDDIVCVRLGDWVEWFGQLDHPEDSQIA